MIFAMRSAGSPARSKTPSVQNPKFAAPRGDFLRNSHGHQHPLFRRFVNRSAAIVRKHWIMPSHEADLYLRLADFRSAVLEADDFSVSLQEFLTAHSQQGSNLLNRHTTPAVAGDPKVLRNARGVSRSALPRSNHTTGSSGLPLARARDRVRSLPP